MTPDRSSLSAGPNCVPGEPLFLFFTPPPPMIWLSDSSCQRVLACPQGAQFLPISVIHVLPEENRPQWHSVMMLSAGQISLRTFHRLKSMHQVVEHHFWSRIGLVIKKILLSYHVFEGIKQANLCKLCCFLKVPHCHKRKRDVEDLYCRFVSHNKRTKGSCSALLEKKSDCCPG